MKRSLLDILACPIDKHHPLELYGDQKDPIQQAVLYCVKCGRFYAIYEGIPVLLPDELRNKDQEIAILRDTSGIPDHIRYKAKPWCLSPE